MPGDRGFVVYLLPDPADHHMFDKLIRNGFTEKDIRDWLDQHGYHGRSARLDHVELHAIQRPGWLQIFRFAGQAKRAGGKEWTAILGVVRDDERYRRTDVMIFDSSVAQQAQLDTWSAGLIVRRRR